MLQFRKLRTISVLASLLVLFLNMTIVAQEVKKIAFVVGVSEYKKDGLPDLQFAHKDANDLADVLEGQGFSVTRLIGEEATHTQVLEAFNEFLVVTSELGKQDIVLISFSGHGLQREFIFLEEGKQRVIEAPFYCVYDTLVSNRKTMIPLNDIVDRLAKQSGSSNNLFLIDACRDNPTKGVKSLDGGTVSNLPSKICMLFSSSPGKKSYESLKIGHGIFTHVLLNGLRGEAMNSRDEVDWLSLAAYAVSEVPRNTQTLLEDNTIVQQPNLVGNLAGSPILATRINLDKTIDKSSSLEPTSAFHIGRLWGAVTPEPLEAPFDSDSITVARKGIGEAMGIHPSFINNAGMKFVLIPPGRFTMGWFDPKKELGIFFNQTYEAIHEVTITKPFFLGTYEVTQSQYLKIMGTDPSVYSRTDTDNSDEVVGESREYPVENVSWEDAQTFIKKLNDTEEDKRLRYRLASEAEWEYACRAGTETHFSTGTSIDNTDANFDRNFGTEQLPTSPIGNYSPNGFGLYDMHGNVFEWCNDWYSPEYYSESPLEDPSGPKSGQSRVIRGGSWFESKFDCRSDSRGLLLPAKRRDFVGFRVACSIELDVPSDE